MLRTYLTTILRLSSLAILALLTLGAVLFWFFAGDIAVAGAAPFAAASARMAVIAGIFLSFFTVTFLRHALARRANAQLINSMLANDELVSMGSDLSSDEIELIRERFEKTLKTLRDNPVDGGKRRQYLSDLPWYIIIGPPATGKTTILRNSGLNFPLADAGEVALQGIGGTRYCDWWISNDAVLIDTAGRYTTQDVNHGVDAAAWGGFLNLLKENRRRRPVNGVLLAISIADVAMAGEAERQRHAETLRQRLRELHRNFEMRLPVYVMFTKCDLIAGFEEYFDAAEDAEREQVWGVTLPLDDEQATFGPQFEKGFLDLVARIERRLPDKLTAERNNSRRCRIYTFPHEFGSLSGVLRGFVSDVFRVNRYEAQPLLRGVYFTSGTQEGTPFDRLLGAMGRSFALAPTLQPPMSGQGKAFFIKRLLTDIVFAEQNLVGRNTKLERRLAAMYAGAYAAIAIVTVALSAYWLYGLNQSLETVQTAKVTAERLDARLQEAERNRGLPNILPALDAARDLQQSVATLGGWGLGGLFGVDARPELEPAANQAYDGILKNYLLTAMTARMQTQIQTLSNSADANNLVLRDQLETYLMVTTGQNYQEQRVEKEFSRQSEAAFTLNPAELSRMERHSERLVALMPGTSVADQPTVQVARSRLNNLPQAADIYARMVQDASRRYQLPPISVANILGVGALRTDAALGGSNVIPGLYTKNGFYEFFLPRLPEYIRNSTGTDWVLGGETIADDAYAALAKDVVDAYVRDYISTWNSAVRQVRAADFETLNRGQTILQELSNPQSPLVALLQTLRDNTELPLPGARTESDAAALPGDPAPVAGIATVVAGNATDALARTAASTAFGNAAWPGTTISNAFLPLTTLVDPQNPRDSLTPVQQLFGDLYGVVSGIATAPDPKAAAFEFVAQRAKSPSNDTFSRLRAVAATKPEPLRSLVTFTTNRTWQLMIGLSHEHLNEKWQQEVLPVCETVLGGRYPFVPSAEEEVQLQDFADLFRPAGIIDQFFKDNLASFVSVKGRQYAELDMQGGGMGFDRESLAQFARAQRIRDAFFGAAGTAPEAKFTVEPAFLDPKALRASFILDEAELIYRHGPVRAMDFVWPSKRDASTALMRITLLDGSTETVQSSGNWAVFRMLSGSGLSKTTGQDQFEFSIEKDGSRASFRLRAGSVTNPFNIGLYSTFRCPPAL